MNKKVQLIFNSVLIGIVVIAVGLTSAEECDKDKVKG